MDPLAVPAMRKFSVMATLVMSLLAALPGSTTSFLSMVCAPDCFAILCKCTFPSDKTAACFEFSLIVSMEVM